MRIRLAALGFIVLVLSRVAPTTMVFAAEKPVQASYLFVFEGESASIAPVSGKSGVFDFTMPVRRSNHLVTWFTDRPVRDAGHVSMRAFVSMWQQDGADTFKADPPNVSVAYNGRTMIAVMSGVRLVGSGAGGQSFRATLSLVEQTTLAAMAKGTGGLAAHAKRAGSNAHAGVVRIPSVSVFVDSVGAVPTATGPSLLLMNKKT